MVIDGTLSQAQTSTEEARVARRELYDLMAKKLQEQVDKMPEQLAALSTAALEGEDDPDAKEFIEDFKRQAAERLTKFSFDELINDLLDCYDDEELIYLATEEKKPIRQRITNKMNRVAVVALKNALKQGVEIFGDDLDSDKKAEMQKMVAVFEKVMSN